MVANKDIALRPKNEKANVSNQKPKSKEQIRAVLKSVKSKIKNKTIKLKLIAEKKGGRAEIKEA